MLLVMIRICATCMQLKLAEISSAPNTAPFEGASRRALRPRSRGATREQCGPNPGKVRRRGGRPHPLRSWDMCGRSGPCASLRTSPDRAAKTGVHYAQAGSVQAASPLPPARTPFAPSGYAVRGAQADAHRWLALGAII